MANKPGTGGNKSSSIPSRDSSKTLGRSLADDELELELEQEYVEMALASPTGALEAGRGEGGSGSGTPLCCDSTGKVFAATSPMLSCVRTHSSMIGQRPCCCTDPRQHRRSRPGRERPCRCHLLSDRCHQCWKRRVLQHRGFLPGQQLRKSSCRSPLRMDTYMCTRIQGGVVALGCVPITL